MNIILKFVTWYIRTHMNHTTEVQRHEILKAINEGMLDAFPEDTNITRTYSTIKWLAEANTDMKAVDTRLPIREFAAEIACKAIQDADLTIK